MMRYFLVTKSILGRVLIKAGFEAASGGKM